MRFVIPELIDLMIEYKDITEYILFFIFLAAMYLIFQKDLKWYFLRCKDADLADKLRDAPTDDLVRQYIEHLKKFYSFEYGLSDTKRIGDIRARQYVVYRYILFFSNTPLALIQELEEVMKENELPTMDEFEPEIQDLP